MQCHVMSCTTVYECNIFMYTIVHSWGVCVCASRLYWLHICSESPKVGLLSSPWKSHLARKMGRGQQLLGMPHLRRALTQKLSNNIAMIAMLSNIAQTYLRYLSHWQTLPWFQLLASLFGFVYFTLRMPCEWGHCQDEEYCKGSKRSKTVKENH